jgi:type II secretory pathway pseudopilin PulG
MSDPRAQARQAEEEAADQAHQMARAIIAAQVTVHSEAPEVVNVPAVLVNGTIQGTANVGDTLTVTDGNWTGEPTSYEQVWMSNGTEVGTGSSYVAQATDTSVECVVTATNSAGSGTVTTSAVTVAAALRS